MPDVGTHTRPPAFGHRRYVVAARYARGAMVHFENPTTLEAAQARLDELASTRPQVLAGVFELRLVKP